VPAGAIGALTIQRALSRGFWAGLLTGLGSSAADVLYACVGIFGLTTISHVFLRWQTPISLIGGAVIVGMGAMIFFSKAKETQATSDKAGLGGCFLSAFAIAIANPVTILSFLAAFATMGIGEVSTLGQGVQMVTGILLGTGCWWCLLSGGAARFRGRMTQKLYQNLNRILGVLLMAFGLYMALRAVIGGNV
ncbi:MAG: LysE family translocator, partial [Oscillospiraceae bacterium]|nr:LysE family translocator [Oscillospiraceae bacterium]